MSKDFVTSVMDVVNYEGWEAIDAEIAVWIESGSFDEAVRERMTVIGSGTREYPDLSLNQQLHRLKHPRGPFGWEHCAICS